jgi:hypothetical protein
MKGKQRMQLKKMKKVAKTNITNRAEQGGVALGAGKGVKNCERRKDLRRDKETFFSLV